MRKECNYISPFDVLHIQVSNSSTSIIVDTYDVILDDIQNKKRDGETFQEITSSLE